MKINMESKINAKVGVSYSLFDGEELLPASIKAIRDKVHYINVVYQKISYLGNPASPDIEEKLQGMVKEGLIDELYLYEPILEIHPRYNELAKRDIGFILAKNRGCDYFLGMDVDEFYDGEQFEAALKYIVDYNISTSAVSIITYLKSPEYQEQGVHAFIEDGEQMISAFVPFLIKIDRTIGQKHGVMFFPCFVDPTRNISCPGRFKLFPVQNIAMHHMSTVRKDLLKKYGNTSATNISERSLNNLENMRQNILDFDFDKSKELPEDLAIYGQKLIKKVENQFNIDIGQLQTEHSV